MSVSEFTGRKKGNTPQDKGMVFYTTLSEVVNKQGADLALPTIIGTLELLKQEIVASQLSQQQEELH